MCTLYFTFVILVAPPTLSLTGRNVVDELRVLTLTCTVQADPAPVITWLKRRDDDVTVILNSARISITNQHRTTNATSTSVLTINRAESSDQGNYICRASNDFNNETSFSTANISVQVRGDYVHTTD